MSHNNNNIITFAHYHKHMITCDTNDSINEGNKGIVEDNSPNLN